MGHTTNQTKTLGKLVYKWITSVNVQLDGMLLCAWVRPTYNDLPGDLPGAAAPAPENPQKHVRP